MVLVQSESGQLLMIPQQALAQMQAQAQAQAQGGGAPRTATPTHASPVQVRSHRETRVFVISVNSNISSLCARRQENRTKMTRICWKTG